MTRLALALMLALAPLPAFAQPATLTAETVVEGLAQPLYAISAGDDRLFVVEQPGFIRIVTDGAVSETPFLDISDMVSTGGEQGLLGLAFHPSFAQNRQFYVNYTDKAGTTQVVGYTVSSDPNRADPGSAKPLFSVEQPYANHNGGWIAFGPDKLLYVGMGDGGSGGDPQGNGQKPDALLGKMLRIDVDAESPAPEIFATGVRNPWRSAFDDDLLYIADVGQNAWEEISVIPATTPGANLGWNVMEGPVCFEAENCDQSGFVVPVHSYSHEESGGCSITGGFVYRGKAIPAIDGHYFYADLCSGKVESFRYADGAATELTDWTSQLGGKGTILSFGTDADGELYYTTLEGGLFRIAAAQ